MPKLLHFHLRSTLVSKIPNSWNLFYRNLLIYTNTMPIMYYQNYFLCSHLNEWVGTTCAVMEKCPWYIEGKKQDVELFLAIYLLAYTPIDQSKI